MKSGKFLSVFLSSALILMSLNPLITAKADTSYEDMAEQVAYLVNEERSKEGLAPLEMSSVMNEAASVRANELAEVFSHTRPDGSVCFTIFDEYDISYLDFAGENIHSGSSTPEDAMKSWLNSTEHHANIMAESAKYIGVSVVYSGGEYYWIQLFSDLGASGGTNYLPTQKSSEILKGDVNSDGFVNASDSSEILAEYALMSSGESGTFNDLQKAAADYNQDGEINSSDASEVLAYYAETSSGK